MKVKSPSFWFPGLSEVSRLSYTDQHHRNRGHVLYCSQLSLAVANLLAAAYESLRVAHARYMQVA